MMQSQKGGIGYHAVQFGDLKLGAVVVVNALGDIYVGEHKIAGLMNESRTGDGVWLEQKDSPIKSGRSDPMDRKEKTFREMLMHWRYDLS